MIASLNQQGRRYPQFGSVSPGGYAQRIPSLGGINLYGFTQEQLDFLVTYMEANLAIPTAAEIAVAVLAAAQTTPIHSDIRKVNGYTIDGDGQDATPWGPV